MCNHLFLTKPPVTQAGSSCRGTDRNPASPGKSHGRGGREGSGMLGKLLLLIALVRGEAALNAGFGPSLLKRFGGWSLCQQLAVFYHRILRVEEAENSKDVGE